MTPRTAVTPQQDELHTPGTPFYLLSPSGESSGFALAATPRAEAPAAAGAAVDLETLQVGVVGRLSARCWSLGRAAAGV